MRKTVIKAGDKYVRASRADVEAFSRKYYLPHGQALVTDLDGRVLLTSLIHDCTMFAYFGALPIVLADSDLDRQVRNVGMEPIELEG